MPDLSLPNRLLLDTHAFLWWEADDPRLPVTVRSRFADPAVTLILSAVSCWEIGTKFRLGKLEVNEELANHVELAALEAGMECLSVNFRHAQKSCRLPMIHKDPFDRLLIAQALEDDLTLVSNEALFDAYGVKRLWL